MIQLAGAGPKVEWDVTVNLMIKPTHSGNKIFYALTRCSWYDWAIWPIKCNSLGKPGHFICPVLSTNYPWLAGRAPTKAKFSAIMDKALKINWFPNCSQQRTGKLIRQWVFRFQWSKITFSFKLLKLYYWRIRNIEPYQDTWHWRLGHSLIVHIRRSMIHFRT
jgi:hypothetical protein